MSPYHAAKMVKRKSKIKKKLRHESNLYEKIPSNRSPISHMFSASDHESSYASPSPTSKQSKRSKAGKQKSKERRESFAAMSKGESYVQEVKQNKLPKIPKLNRISTVTMNNKS